MIEHSESVIGSEVLKRWRTSTGTTQRQIAQHLGITSSAVSEWERSLSRPSREYAIATDSLLGAGGEVVAAFGYLAGTDSVDVTQLRAQLDDLRGEVLRLSAIVQSLQAAVIEQDADDERPGGETRTAR